MAARLRPTWTAESVRLLYTAENTLAESARILVSRKTIEFGHEDYLPPGHAVQALQIALLEQLEKLKPLPDDPADPFAADRKLAELLESMKEEGRTEATKLRAGMKAHEAKDKPPKAWRFGPVPSREPLLPDELFPIDEASLIDEPESETFSVESLIYLSPATTAGIPSLEQTAFDAMPLAIRVLAYATWIDLVLPGLRNPPALARAVHTNVLDLYSQSPQRKERNGQTALSLDATDRWVLVPAVEGPIADILHRGVNLLTSEAGIDLLEWQVTEAHRRFQRGESDFRNLRVEGGWSALAHDHLGISKTGASADIRAIVVAQAHLRFEAWGIRGNLLSYTEPVHHAPGRRAVVTMTLGDMLLAGFARAMSNEKDQSLSAREGRQLVPILGKAALVGRRNDFAAQRRMVWRFAVALRARASELAQDGAIEMPLDLWAALAAESGLPRSPDLLGRVRRAWETGDDKTPPLIVPSDNGRRVTLHESRKDALDFMVRGWKLSERGRAAGKAGAAGRLIRKRKPPTR